jgi:hypothetical protein
MKKERLTPGLLYSISDNAHFLGGAAAVFFANLWGIYAALYAVIIVILVAGWKEAIYDPSHEDKTVAGSGLRDWLGYVFGSSIALIIIYVRAHLIVTVGWV